MDPGSYLIVPRTSGCTMSHTKHPEKFHKPERLLVTIVGNDALSRRVKTSNNEKTLSLLFDITITDIFNKFDVRNQKCLGFYEFKALSDVIGRQITEDDFR